MTPRPRPPANARPAGLFDPPPARGEAAPALPPYPAYRPSGVDWLGDVPQHWDLTRLKNTVALLRNGIWGNDPDGETDIVCIRVADYDRVALTCNPDKPTMRAVTAAERIGRQLDSGDLLLEKSGGGEQQPVGAVVQYTGTAPAVCSNFVARMAVNVRNDARFITYLHAHLYEGRVNVRSIKQTTGIQNLDSDAYLNERVALPPVAEQRAIAGFLDRATGRADALAAKKRRLLGLLAEKRQALITHAVTRGLDPHAPVRPTAIDWLGDVPRHWEAPKLKHVCRVQNGVTLGKRYEDADLVERPYLRVANVQDGFLDLDEIKTLALPPADAPRHELRAGDVLMTEGGDFDKLGRGCVWHGQVEGCLHQNHIFAVRPDQRRLLPEYLAALLVSDHGKHYFTSTSSQTTNLATTNTTKLGNFPLMLPPPNEQRAIVAHLDAETARLDALSAKINAAIDRLAEYRAALITAAVTGRVDVRATTLAEEAA